MNIKTGVALVLGALVASRGAAQDVRVGTRVRITTRLGFRYQGQLTALDSMGLTVLPDDSTPSTLVLRSDVKKLERSLGLEEVVYHAEWASALVTVGMAGGAVYGATGWGTNSHPKGVLGGVLGALVGGTAVALLVGDQSERTTMEEQWKKVNLESEVRPIITSGAGGRLLVGLSLALPGRSKCGE